MPRTRVFTRSNKPFPPSSRFQQPTNTVKGPSSNGSSPTSRSSNYEKKGVQSSTSSKFTNSHGRSVTQRKGSRSEQYPSPSSQTWKEEYSPRENYEEYKEREFQSYIDLFSSASASQSSELPCLLPVLAPVTSPKEFSDRSGKSWSKNSPKRQMYVPPPARRGLQSKLDVDNLSHGTKSKSTKPILVPTSNRKSSPTYTETLFAKEISSDSLHGQFNNISDKGLELALEDEGYNNDNNHENNDQYDIDNDNYYYSNKNNNTRTHVVSQITKDSVISTDFSDNGDVNHDCYNTTDSKPRLINRPKTLTNVHAHVDTIEMCSNGNTADTTDRRSSNFYQHDGAYLSSSPPLPLSTQSLPLSLKLSHLPQSSISPSSSPSVSQSSESDTEIPVASVSIPSFVFESSRVHSNSCIESLDEFINVCVDEDPLSVNDKAVQTDMFTNIRNTQLNGSAYDLPSKRRGAKQSKSSAPTTTTINKKDVRFDDKTLMNHKDVNAEEVNGDIDGGKRKRKRQRKRSKRIPATPESNALVIIRNLPPPISSSSNSQHLIHQHGALDSTLDSGVEECSQSSALSSRSRPGPGESPQSRHASSRSSQSPSDDGLASYNWDPLDESSPPISSSNIPFYFKEPDIDTEFLLNDQNFPPLPWNLPLASRNIDDGGDNEEYANNDDDSGSVVSWSEFDLSLSSCHDNAHTLTNTCCDNLHDDPSHIVREAWNQEYIDTTSTGVSSHGHRHYLSDRISQLSVHSFETEQQNGASKSLDYRTSTLSCNVDTTEIRIVEHNSERDDIGDQLKWTHNMDYHSTTSNDSSTVADISVDGDTDSTETGEFIISCYITSYYKNIL